MESGKLNYYIYVIWEEDSPYYKIGVSIKPTRRLIAIQCGNPHKLRMIRKIKMGGRDNCYETETAVNEKWAKDKVRGNGEWFILEHKDITAIERFIEKARTPMVDS